jgi:hypothetical protein
LSCLCTLHKGQVLGSSSDVIGTGEIGSYCRVYGDRNNIRNWDSELIDTVKKKQAFLGSGCFRLVARGWRHQQLLNFQEWSKEME